MDDCSRRFMSASSCAITLAPKTSGPAAMSAFSQGSTRSTSKESRLQQSESIKPWTCGPLARASTASESARPMVRIHENKSSTDNLGTKSAASCGARIELSNSEPLRALSILDRQDPSSVGFRTWIWRPSGASARLFSFKSLVTSITLQEQPVQSTQLLA